MNKSETITQRLNKYLETSQHRSYFLIFATVAFVFVMVVFGILPAFSAFSLQGAENEKRQIAIDQLNRKLSDLRTLTQQSQEKEDIIEYFNQIFPNATNEEILFLETILIANNNGVYLSDMTFKESTTYRTDLQNRGIVLDNKVKAIDIALKVEGSQQTLNNFIANLERKRRIYNIQDFNLNRKPDQDIVLTTPDRYYILTLNINVYYYDVNYVE